MIHGFDDSTKEKVQIFTVTPEMFGAVGDGVADDTEAVKAAIEAGNYVLFSQTYKVTGKIDVATSESRNIVKTLDVKGEVLFDNGYFHVTGYNVRICGGGTISGYSPDALIVLGGIADDQEVSCINAIIENLYLYATTPCVGITLRNYYLGNYGCYCNTIRSIYAENCTTAIRLVGDANANSITDINLMSYSDDTILAMFLFEGLVYNGVTYAPLENNFSNSFYYRGINTPMILIKASCGNRMSKNAFTNITGEQQGNNAIFMKIEDGATPFRNIFVGIVSNTLLGYFSLADEQKIKDGENTFISEKINFQPWLNGLTGYFKDGISHGPNEMSYENSFTCSASEDTQFKLFDTDGSTATGISPKIQGAFVEVFVVENRNGLTICQRCERALLFVTNTAMSFVEQATGSRLTINGFSLNYKPGNNGTGKSDIRISCYYKVTAHEGYASALVRNIATN